MIPDQQVLSAVMALLEDELERRTPNRDRVQLLEDALDGCPLSLSDIRRELDERNAEHD